MDEIKDITTEMHATSIRMIEAVSASEILVNIFQTIQCNSPEDSYFHTFRYENLKSHKSYHVPIYRLSQL